MERTYEWSCVYIVYSSIFPLYLHCHTNIFIVRHKEAILSWVNVNGTQVSFACILKKGSFSFYIFSFIFFYSYWVMRRKIYSELHFIFLDNLFSFHATCIRKEYFWINHKISIEPNSFILIILIQIHAKKLFFLHSPIIYRLNHWIRFRFFFHFHKNGEEYWILFYCSPSMIKLIHILFVLDMYTHSRFVPFTYFYCIKFS